MKCVFIATLPKFSPTKERINVLLDMLAVATLDDFDLTPEDDDELLKQRMVDASCLLALYQNLGDREQAEERTQPFSYPIWVTGGFQSEAPELYRLFAAVPISVEEQMAFYALQDVHGRPDPS